MSERIDGFMVVLSEPMRDEDAQRVQDAILLLSPVGSVIPLVDSGRALPEELSDGTEWF